MPLPIVFTATERERLGVFINNLSMLAAQMMLQSSPEFSRRALANLAKIRSDDGPLLKRLDELARESGDESPLRLIEDLARQPTDIAQMMTTVRRCLLASAFLGHCITQPTHPHVAAEAVNSVRRLH